MRLRFSINKMETTLSEINLTKWEARFKQTSGDLPMKPSAEVETLYNATPPIRKDTFKLKADLNEDTYEDNWARAKGGNQPARNYFVEIKRHEKTERDSKV